MHSMARKKVPSMPTKIKLIPAESMTHPTPWDEITQPEIDYNVRPVELYGLIPVYWGKDVHGNCLLITELEGDHQKAFFNANLDIRGIQPDLRQRSDGRKQTLVLTLTNHADLDLFHALCKPLTRSLRDASNSGTALTIVLNHLKRWQRFLAGNKPQLLSPWEVRGLFAELHFLQSLYTHLLNHSEALNAWTGPRGGNQDFVFRNTAVEVKTLSNKGPNHVNIASENQLESPAENLYLTTSRIIESAELPSAISLNEMVQRIETDLTGSSALDEYHTKLAEVGYAELFHYDNPVMQVAETRIYQVAGEFPRIIRTRLPDGIQNVKYQLQIDAVEAFACPLETIWNTSK